jgi:succinate dehydrogenase / fumarate reductase iron-sulfur subunit
VNTGNAPDGNAIPIQKDKASQAFDSATCIGCGACVASCKNASASLFTSAKINQMSLLPQGELERDTRVKNMVAQMDAENFGACTNEAECSAACPKGIPFKNITHMNAEFIRAQFAEEPASGGGGE